MISRKSSSSSKLKSSMESTTPNKMKNISPPQSSSSSQSFSNNKERKKLSIGFTPKEQTIKQEDLTTIIPSSKLFSPDISNVQRARELKNLLSCLGDWASINDPQMLKLIQNVKENIESLDDKMSALVSRILDSDWCSRSNKVVKAFETFLSELTVLHPSYTGVVLQSLIKKFLPQFVDAFRHHNPDQIQPEDEKVFEIAHRNLARLLEAFPIPRTRDSTIKTMNATYPYMGKSPYIHFCYVKNLLTAMHYAPQISDQILHLVIHKLTRMDVNIPREEAESFNEAVIQFDPSIKTESGSRVKLSQTQIINQISKECNPLVTTLDICLYLIFEKLEEINEETFKNLMSTFETEILPTFGLNHVQFLYFYLVSTSPCYSKTFLDFLWKKATNLNVSSVLRMQAMAYVSGILSRSNGISVKILKRWLTTMADWANSYIDQKVKNSHWSSVNIQTHGLFYSVCQCIFYVFAFRNKDLVGSKRCTAFTSTLNLGRLVTCDLNPLKAVIHPVAIAFVKAAHIHQISYCQTVLERNQRATIPTSAIDSNILDTFFPFDPFCLPRCKVWVDSGFRTYEAYLPEVKIEKCESPYKAVHNEDSIDMELSCSYHEKNNFMDRFLDRNNLMDEG